MSWLSHDKIDWFSSYNELVGVFEKREEFYRWVQEVGDRGKEGEGGGLNGQIVIQFLNLWS